MPLAFRLIYLYLPLYAISHITVYTNVYQFKVLVKDRNKAAKQYANAFVGPATIEEIMLFYVKGEMQ